MIHPQSLAVFPKVAVFLTTSTQVTKDPYPLSPFSPRLHLPLHYDITRDDALT